MTRVPLSDMPKDGSGGSIGVKGYPELLNDKLVDAYRITLHPKTSYLDEVEAAPWYNGDLSDYDVDYDETTGVGSNEVRPEFEALSDKQQEVVMHIYESDDLDESWTTNEVIETGNFSKNTVKSYIGEGKTLVDEGWVRFTNEKDGQKKLWTLKKSPYRQLAADGGLQLVAIGNDRREERYPWLKYDWDAIPDDLRRRDLFDGSGLKDENIPNWDWFGCQNKDEVIESFGYIADIVSQLKQVFEIRQTLENPHISLPYQLRVRRIRTVLNTLQSMQHDVREFFVTHSNLVRDAFGSCSPWFTANSDKTNIEETRYPSNLEEHRVELLDRSRTFLEKTYLEGLCQREANSEALHPDRFADCLYYTEEAFSDFFKFAWQFYEKLIEKTSVEIPTQEEGYSDDIGSDNQPMSASPSFSKDEMEAPSEDELDGDVMHVTREVLEEAYQHPIGTVSNPNLETGSLTWDEFKERFKEKSNDTYSSGTAIRRKLVKFHKWCYIGDGPSQYDYQGVYVWDNGDEGEDHDIRVRLIKQSGTREIFDHYHDQREFEGTIGEWPQDSALTSLMD